MDATIITCLTQFATTALTILASIGIAFLTYRSQKKKSDAEIKRLQTVNCQSALELFRAYIANLILFVSPKNEMLDRNTLLTCIDKMKLIEQYLSELTEVELPDNFIKKFQFYRLKIAFQRLSFENCLKNNSDIFLPSSMFDYLETLKLISTLEEFISEFDSKKTEG